MQLQELLTSNIKILNSFFIQSAQKNSDSMPAYCTEIAMLGRSNVGKSSIINFLLNQKLAKSSSTPGKTKLINFFATTWEVQQKDDAVQNFSELKDRETQNMKIPLVVIDFPGFGYAKVDKATKQAWDRNLSNFIMERQSIKLFCHLIDSRHPNLTIDSEIKQFLEKILHSRKDCKILEIYTKDDKLKKNDLRRLQAQGKITISTLKRSEEKSQNLYRMILSNSLDWK